MVGLAHGGNGTISKTVTELQLHAWDQFPSAGFSLFVPWIISKLLNSIHMTYMNFQIAIGVSIVWVIINASYFVCFTGLPTETIVIVHISEH